MTEDKVDLSRLRVRKVGQTMRADDVVLFDEMFFPMGFSTEFERYYAGNIVGNGMTGKIIFYHEN